MHYLLKQFWKWLPVSYEEYSKKGITQIHGNYEDNFPKINELIEHGKKIVDDNLTSDNDIDDLLTIMGIDNEAEEIMEYIEENSSDEQINRLIYIGINHPLYNARWQVAELLYRRKPQRYAEFLKILSSDSNMYVRKRAMNCLELLSDNS